MILTADNGWMNAWRVSKRLPVIRTVLLILGLDPSIHESGIGISPNAEHPANFDAILAAVTEAILSGELKADVVSKISGDILVIGMIPDDKTLKEMAVPDWKETTIAVDDLKAWLLSKAIAPPFFFANDVDPLNPDGPYYAPKLAAAIKAWTAVAGDAKLVEASGNPKQAIETWLAHHGAAYGLMKNGEINEAGFNQISTIANWKSEGGAISLKPSTASKTKKAG